MFDWIVLIVYALATAVLWQWIGGWAVLVGIFAVAFIKVSELILFTLVTAALWPWLSGWAVLVGIFAAVFITAAPEPDDWPD